jgi:hypothetical protein
MDGVRFQDTDARRQMKKMKFKQNICPLFSVLCPRLLTSDF